VLLEVAGCCLRYSVRPGPSVASSYCTRQKKQVRRWVPTTYYSITYIQQQGSNRRDVVRCVCMFVRIFEFWNFVIVVLSSYFELILYI
jgi:hypothetical protein